LKIAEGIEIIARKCRGKSSKNCPDPVVEIKRKFFDLQASKSAE